MFIVESSRQAAKSARRVRLGISGRPLVRTLRSASLDDLDCRLAMTVKHDGIARLQATLAKHGLRSNSLFDRINRRIVKISLHVNKRSQQNALSI
jgi:hypothetical protein